MGIIWKHIFRNIRSNKGKSFLIIFSVMIVSALLFVTLSISDVMTQEYTKILRDENGHSDIVVQTEPEKRSHFFEYNDISGMEILPEIRAVGFFEKQRQSAEWFEIYAISFEDYFKNYTTALDFSLNGLDDNQIILSGRTAQELSLQNGDMIMLTINGQPYEFNIAWIMTDNNGLFADETRFRSAIISIKTAQEIFGVQDKANRLNIFLYDNTGKQTALNILSLTYPEFIVEETVSQRDIDAQIGSFSMIFFLMFFASCAMCVFIVLSGFRAIVAERLTVLGTFRSAGATKRKANTILLFEVLLYSIIGGLLALIIGTMGLPLIASVLGAKSVKLTVGVVAMIGTLAFAVLLSLLCALPSILAASKIPIKEIVLGTHKNKVRRNVFSGLIGMALIGAGVTIPAFSILAYKMVFIVISLGFVFSGIVLVIPLAASGLIKMFERLAPNSLAPKNLRKNKQSISIISLIAIGMTVILLINNSMWLQFSVTDDAYELLGYHIEVIGAPSNAELADKLKQVDGVTAVGGVFVKTEVEVEGREPLMSVYGMDERKFNEFYNFTMQDNSSFDKLTQGKNIIVSEDYLLRFGLNVGDKINNYNIVGVVSEMQNSGNVAFISEDNFRLEFGKEYYSFIALKASEDIDKTVENIRTQLWDIQINLTTLESIKQTQMDMSATIFMVMNLLALMSVLIGIIGVVNNLIIHFLERKRTLAMLRAVGMSSKSGIRMIAAEALITGIVGAVLGYIGGLLINRTIPALFRLFEFPTKPIPFMWEQVAVCFAAGIGICLIAAVGSMRKIKKLNIISEIKYE